MNSDDDEDLARAIANSLQDDTQYDHSYSAGGGWDGEADDDLAVVVEESLFSARKNEQLLEDATLALDLATVESLVDSEQLERQETAHAAISASHADWQQEERQAGSWDCPICTLRNRPYRATCGACGKDAPVSVLTFGNVPAKQRFGVELELIIPDGTNHGFDCPWIAQELSKMGLPTSFAGYTHEVTKEWKIVRDSSLNSSNHDLCLELVSPILVGEAGLAQLRVMLESIRKLGIAINSTCGFHVHVDADSGSSQGVPAMATLPGLSRLVQCFCATERAFDAVVASRTLSTARNRRANRHQYCQSNVLALGTLSNRQRWNRIASCRSIDDLVELVNPGSDRYRKLNLTNLVKPGRANTCEFRQHGGVQELLAAEAWVRLILSFCSKAATHSPASRNCLLPDQATVQDELQALFGLVSCPGLHAFFMLDRKLFHWENNVARAKKKQTRDWKCKRCKRRFHDSRSLSQHSKATGHNST